MCGIAGVFNYREQNAPVDRRLLETMTSALAHRGPNGDGIVISGPVGLGHRRLAIVDLSSAGAQPMANSDGSLHICYNGEFYNHGKFRGDLASRHTFRGRSDTETLLYLFEERGPACLADVMGIFGVAFWDARRRRLVLARDHLGVKQLYYFDDGRRVLFASEMKALLATGLVPRELDPEALNQYLHFHTPLFERTFFRHIRQVGAGQYLEIDERGLRCNTYWTVPFEDDVVASPQAAIDELRATLNEVVTEQLLSDVPVGAFFSGGIDSSTVAAFAKRAGRPPRCFGVHFDDPTVVDERPYQEQAAKALGLELDLITMDGSSFPDDLTRLLRSQDQPVIGAAMLPMYYVSKLAASRVRVCLGGQAADEIFGGYARYGLAAPLTVARSWVSGRLGKRGDRRAGLPAVGGNLKRQLANPRTLARLTRALSPSWARRYFDHFAKVDEAEWRSVIAADEVVSRETCWQTFHDKVLRSGGRTPADKVMHWDLQTYLTGLFQQDDRMSMANSLESRVPLADPRLVRLAFRLPFDLKFRSGASKWVLRQAIADVLPPFVLTRRKIGFDTPAARWMREAHAGFVREILLGPRARQRGLWSISGLENLLTNGEQPRWFDIAWKALCIEVWAREFLDQPQQAAPVAPAPSITSHVQDGRPKSSRVDRVKNAIEELRELDAGQRAFRVKWELSLRTGVTELLERSPRRVDGGAAAARLLRHSPFQDSLGVGTLMSDRLGERALGDLRGTAQEASRGRVRCFGRWTADFGQPIDWQLNPATGRRWNAQVHWSRALSEGARVGDVKLSWEAARFPHAYHMARAATMVPALRGEMAAALAEQIQGFVAANPYGRGIHWASGQELAIRMLAWLFGCTVLQNEARIHSTLPLVAESVYLSAQHLERYLDYARKAIYNNHLVAEALGLLTAGTVLPEVRESAGWTALGTQLLDECAVRQFRSDGGYLQDAHNYHRASLEYFLLASGLVQRRGSRVPDAWQRAMERSLDFLIAHQNPMDGRLPNYGGNDGSYPAVLSTCDFSDFRPILQAASVQSRGERVFEPGPWDEEAAWLCGAEAVRAAPLRTVRRASVSFASSGYHVVRGHDEATFAALRCGNITDRFSQIDMLSLDVWWRGHNVIVDAGSYLYNGPARWHDHFLGTTGHSTVQIDGLDQMLHYRRFKVLYWTKAKLLRFDDHPGWSVVEGEHYGFQRTLPGCTHRRAVLLVKDDALVVVDTVAGSGVHDVRLQWIGGTEAFGVDTETSTLTLETTDGPFQVRVLDGTGAPAGMSVLAGAQNPPRGWLSRYYGEKKPVPSLHAGGRVELPATLVTIMSAERASVERRGEAWSARVGARSFGFELRQGRFENVTIGDELPVSGVVMRT